jgi:hypothetical protein
MDFARTPQPRAPPLNHREALEVFLAAILDRLFADAEPPAARDAAERAGGG